ncbi:MAG: GIY-YIG nuclease family protein [Nitrospinota bacterium]|nr:GIY-YIG nuclease family protein [Nitrospinota bacterium]
MSGSRTDEGLYVIALWLPAWTTVTVGALGRIGFAPGLYLYAGSAARGIESRVARHRAMGKKLRWHIDYFRRKAQWQWAVAFPASVGECPLARMVAEATAAAVAHPRFGASDCRCPGHLLVTRQEPAMALGALVSMGGRPMAEESGAKCAGPVE